GLDITVTPVPVTPAAHYVMGGVASDLNARTTLPGLYAAGECAATGVHGANRLASNSLLEGLVFGARAAEAMADEAPDPGRGERGDDRGARGPAAADGAARRAELRQRAWKGIGLERKGEGLRDVISWLAGQRSASGRPRDREEAELRNLVDVGWTMAV